jgi:hypothetical protein
LKTLPFSLGEVTVSQFTNETNQFTNLLCISPFAMGEAEPFFMDEYEYEYDDVETEVGLTWYHSSR